MKLLSLLFLLFSFAAYGSATRTVVADTIKTTGGNTITIPASNGIMALTSGGGSVGITTAYSGFSPVGFGTIVTPQVFYTHTGDLLHMHGTFICGSPGGSTVQIPLPASLTVDTTKISTSGIYPNMQVVGHIWVAGNHDTWADPTNTAAIFFDGSDTSNLYISVSSNSSGHIKAAGNAFAGVACIAEFVVDGLPVQ